MNLEARLKLFACSAMIACLAFAGCATTSNTIKTYPEETDPITIGVFTMLSGDASSYGEAAQKGLDLAEAAINDQGGLLGRPVELLYEDTALDRDRAVSTVQKFIEVDDLDLIISAEGSGATTATTPLTEASERIMMVALASSPEIKHAGDYTFRIVASDDYQGQMIADYLEENDIATAATMYVNDPYGLGIADVFESAFDGTVVVRESFEDGATDFRTQLLKIREADPEAVVLVARYEFPAIMRQKAELDIGARFITSETVFNPELVATAGTAAEGTMVPFFEPPEHIGWYTTAYHTAYGEEPAAYSALGYDALTALARGVEAAGTTDPRAVKDALYGVAFDGATGHISFDDYGEVGGKEFTWYTIHDGELIQQ